MFLETELPLLGAEHQVVEHQVLQQLAAVDRIEIAHDAHDPVQARMPLLEFEAHVLDSLAVVILACHPLQYAGHADDRFIGSICKKGAEGQYGLPFPQVLQLFEARNGALGRCHGIHHFPG